jgi:hypothetical protein
MNIPRGVLGIGAMCAEDNGCHVTKVDMVLLECKEGNASAVATDGRALIALEWTDKLEPTTMLAVVIPKPMAIRAGNICVPAGGDLSVVVDGEKATLNYVARPSDDEVHTITLATPLKPPDPLILLKWREVVPTYNIINPVKDEAQKNQAVRIGFTAELLQKLLAMLQTVMENVDTLGAENPDKLVMDVPLYPYRPIVFRKMGQNGVKLSAALMPADTDAAGK